MASVSVIIPTFNRYPLLRLAVDSVLKQTHRDIEIIVIDDGSTDDTPALFAQQFPSVHYVKIDHSGLPAVARNVGIRLAKGEFVAFLDSDDQWLPNKLSKQVEPLQRNPDIGLACSNAFVMYDDRDELSRPYLPNAQGTAAHTLETLLDDNFVITSTAVVRRSLFDQVGLFEEAAALQFGEDYDLWLRIAAMSEILYIPDPLAVYRDIPSHSIRAGLSQAMYWQARLLIVRRLRRFLKHRRSSIFIPKRILDHQEGMFLKATVKALLSDHRYVATIPHITALCVHDPLSIGKAALRKMRRKGRHLAMGKSERLVEPTTACSPDKPLKLHLGCGEVYLPGYINVDYPQTRHSVQRHAKADICADLSQLSYPIGTVDEIRLHHVFEHFERPVALRLLIDWYAWLKDGGQLIIETPDFHRSVQEYLRSQAMSDQLKILRHLFGSHEAGWAVHYDGWYCERFTHVLTALGYRNLRFTTGEWQGTYNITVCCTKDNPHLSRAEQVSQVRELLRLSLVDGSPTEMRMLETWMEQFQSTGHCTRAA